MAAGGGRCVLERWTVAVEGPTAGVAAALSEAVAPRVGALAWDTVVRGPLTFLECRFDATADTGALPPAIAASLADWIVGVRQADLLARLIGQRYTSFGREEQSRILALAQARLASGTDGPAGRRAQVRRRLADYLEHHQSVVLDGFVTFRLKDYMDDLAGAVDQAVEDFVLEREYREFLELLRYVVESRADRPARVHCFLQPDGVFSLEDDSGSGLGPPDTDVVDQRGVGMEDFLVSALVTLAPRRVELHLPGGGALSGDALTTLDEVFAGAVGVCAGCERCARRARG